MRMNRACTRGIVTVVVGVEPAPSATGGCHVAPSVETCTLNATGPPAGGPPPRPPRPRAPAVPAESISRPARVYACGNSIWNHIPGCWGVPESHRAPGVGGAMTLPAAAALWLALTFHSDALVSGAGTVGSRSPSVHGVFRTVALRTAATSSAATIPPEFPKLVRT